jgi:hypothetical protein
LLWLKVTDAEARPPRPAYFAVKAKAKAKAKASESAEVPWRRFLAPGLASPSLWR